MCPFDQGRAPCQACAHPRQQHQLARFEPSVIRRIGERYQFACTQNHHALDPQGNEDAKEFLAWFQGMERFPFKPRLDEALRLNSQLRFQARNDSDFQNLAEDPRFTELLYPDPGAELGASDHGIGEEEPV